MEIDQIGVKERINEIKEENSMNQREFSQSIGIQQSDLSSYLSGKKSIGMAETVKELIAAIKRRDEHVDALIRVNEKHADNLAELIKQMKKATALKDDGAGCADASGFSDK